MSFKVIKSGINRKLAYDFLLVVHCNFCRITNRLREIWSNDLENFKWPKWRYFKLKYHQGHRQSYHLKAVVCFLISNFSFCGQEMEMGHLSWPRTHVTHHTVDPWPTWPMTHDPWPLHYFILLTRLGGVAWWHWTTLSVLKANKIMWIKILSLQLW